MLLGFMYAGGPVFHRTPMAQELHVWLADGSTDVGFRLDVAAEIFDDVYLAHCGAGPPRRPSQAPSSPSSTRPSRS